MKPLFASCVIFCLFSGILGVNLTSSRIYTEDAALASPFHVLIIYTNTNNIGRQGGGSLITLSHVLTTASNIVGYVKWQVGYGSTVRSQLKYVTSTIASPHMSYGEGDYTAATVVHRKNDIGIVYLPAPLVASATVATIPIGAATEPIALDNVAIRGFGETATTTASPELKSAFVQVDACDAGTTPSFETMETAQLPKYVCSKSALVSLCSDDYGGGVTKLIKNQNVLVAIASLSTDCGPNEEGAYIRVGSYKKWISSMTNGAI